MKGDFTRNTFDPLQHFSRVLMQQGRVQLDADWNEQADIALHYLRSLAADLIGPHGGLDPAFLVQQHKNPDGQGVPFDFLVGAGNYYVNGILCESEGVAYAAQSGHGVNPTLPAIEQGAYLIYLDVWERHISCNEAPGIRETALLGPDTATRARVEWQAKLAPLSSERGDDIQFKNDYSVFRSFLENQGLYQANKGRLMAAVPRSKDVSDACVVPADNRYRGIENQLYRVEIHRGGVAWDANGENGRNQAATFKWSRENGSVTFAVSDVHVNGASNVTTVTLDDFGRDRKLGLAKDDWVELVDDDYVLRNDAQPLLRVLETDSETLTVTLEGQAGAGVGNNRARHPLLRRWDQRLDAAAAKLAEGGAPLVQVDATPAGLWLKLEDGIQVRFQAGEQYHTGDYWLIPARSGSGDIEWPRQPDPAHPDTTLPAWVGARGVAHGYAPLAALVFDKDGGLVPGTFVDLRRKLIALWT
ncbi:DUF6519 domain-containing protein [Janthinobacterium fluminis]|uniref:DUF6519 domain-containing protein n=1 Tax=Janthinobacterium fluminis TaxID=2987524 RepID=A0ABT5JXV5_9BURK|nr:DUF6519 domain-containing protein [Janthinobacterium fluminis]MDC8757000.1 DUF6519 domain-containing protein [Janthinobacterium fluminis]